MNSGMTVLVGTSPKIAGGSVDLEKLAGKVYNVKWTDGLVTQWQVG